ncbi:MAG: hypothetical protein RL038_1151 [Actinomycetota bacterium]|jgi:hypothetical protein
MSHLTASPNAVNRQPQYRLNKRGKLVVGGLLSTLLAGVFFTISAFFGGVVQAAEPNAESYEFRTIVVAPGDSLWQIADDVAPTADPREVIDLIVAVNELDKSAHLQVGQTLLVPNL